MSVPGDFIAKTGSFCVHQDPLIPLPGFLVVASVRHIHSLADMWDAEYSEFSQLLRIAQSIIKQATGVEHLTLVQEESALHFHLWFFPWTKSVMERYGRPSLSLIRAIMSDLRSHPIGDKQWQELKDSNDVMKDLWYERQK